VPAIDPIKFRNAAGQFMTGVTVVTTIDAAGERAGLTANSFTSVSLDPPMVLVCIGNETSTVEAFKAGKGFVVHVLSDAQKGVSMQFAAKGIDRFEGLDVSDGFNGLPVVAGALATFECSTAHVYEGGDHLIFVGEVQRLSTGDTEAPALGYFRGRYFSS
jgi:flavin reductase (DIM6/NTAB) family NADH-FMN oxidoreductase RutF